MTCSKIVCVMESSLRSSESSSNSIKTAGRGSLSSWNVDAAEADPNISRSSWSSLNRLETSKAHVG